MAETLGAVASAVAVAEVGLKLGGAVLKLRRLWEDVQAVPVTIGDLMTELEILEPIVDESEHQDTLSLELQSDRSARLGSSYCRAAVLELRTLVESLSHDIDSQRKRKRYLGRVKVTLSRETIAKAEAKLQRAVALLQSSQMNHLMYVRDGPPTHTRLADLVESSALTRRQPELIVQRLRADEARLEERERKFTACRDRGFHVQNRMKKSKWKGVSILRR